MAFTCVPVVAQWGTISYIYANQASCVAGQWSVFTPADLDAYNALILSGASPAAGTVTSSFLPVMTVAEALPIFVAISAIWGLAFAIRAVSSLLKSNSGENQND